MIKKKMLYISLSLFVFSLLLTYQTSASLSPYIGFEVGDEFEFQFSKFDVYRHINGSLVIDEDGSDLINNNITVTINEITEANDGFFKELYGSSTYVNVTETFKRGVFNKLTLLDAWFFYYYQVELSFDNWIMFFDPEWGINTGIESPDTSDYANFAGIPVLATTNTTFYQSLEDEIPDYSGTPPMPPDRMSDERDEELRCNNRITQASLKDDIFKMNVTNVDSISGETASNESWSIEGSTNFYVEINTQQGIVDKLSWLITYNLILGSTTDDFVYETMIKNLNPGVTAKSDFQVYQGLFLIVIGLIVIQLKKKK